VVRVQRREEGSKGKTAGIFRRQRKKLISTNHNRIALSCLERREKMKQNKEGKQRRGFANWMKKKKRSKKNELKGRRPDGALT